MKFKLELNKHNPWGTIWLIDEQGSSTPIIYVTGAGASLKHQHFALQLLRLLNEHIEELDSMNLELLID